MSVINGQLANQTTFNNAFMSRTAATTSTVAKVALANTDLESGAQVVNAQRAINKIYEGVGISGEADANVNNYASENYIADGDSRKVAIEKLDTQLKATQDDLDDHKTNVNAHPQYLTEPEADLLYDTLGSAATVQSNLNTHVGDTANPHSVTKTQVGLSNVTNDAQLKRAAGDFNSFTEKAVGVSDDIVLIEDSADSFNKKKMKLSQVLGGGSGGGKNYITNGDAEAGTTGWATFNGALTGSAFASTDYVSVPGGHNIPSGVFDIEVIILSVSTPCGLTVGGKYLASYGSATFLAFSPLSGGGIVDITADATVTFSEVRPRVIAGTANVTFTTSSVSPLSGTNSFILTKDAANRQYQGVAYDFTIDRSSQAKVLDIGIDYIVNSGSFTAGSVSTNSDVIAYIYDITNQKIIEPSSFKFLSNSSTVSDAFSATFQSSYNSTSYRLILLVATTNASAWSLKLDNFSVSPSVYAYGTPITDWQSYTPTWSGSGGTPSLGNGTLSGRWRRVGDNVEIQTYLLWGSTTNGNSSASWTFSPPSGLTIDSAKLAAGTNAVDGAAVIYDSGTSYYTGVPISVGNAFRVQVNNLGSQIGSSNPMTWASSDSLVLSVKAPVLGWSSSVQMSDSADTRVVAAAYNNIATTSLAPTTVTQIKYTNRDYDTHGAYNPTTGEYTVPVSGWYSINAGLIVSGTNTGGSFLVVYKNGVSTDRRFGGSSGDVIMDGTVDIQANQGDKLTFYVYVTNSGISTASPQGYNHFEIRRISGPQAIAATETVSALYKGSPPTGTLSGAYNLVTFGTKVKDSHGAYNSGSYTVPASGQYDIEAQISVQSTVTANHALEVSIFIDGAFAYSHIVRAQASVTTYFMPHISVKAVPLLAGQVVSIRSFVDGTSVSYQSNGGVNFFSITRSGSY